ncbi:class A beta-lactamase-related serine hydrolase [Corallococcus sp. AB011P]|uniref:serine hydrolase domain-containing protein n=1 Tax=Corallococcus sp. AB011P TaxID=2316735 RepID=UPI000EA2509F|nr:serine hydrolase domain-containing protein [Corallococcus sp. AB011P]RKG56433.1 class A beta-lactamase-related serine hydrolase [Corallococcus sp. AB011P]
MPASSALAPRQRALRLSVLVLGTLLAVAPASAAQNASYPLPPASSRHEAQVQQARAFAQKLLKDFQLPGLSVAVAHRGQVLWSEGFGYADLEQGIPVTPLTRFRVGSVSKVLSTAAVALLGNTYADFAEEQAAQLGEIFISAPR